MKIAITGSASIPENSLTFLTLKLDRLTAKLDRSKLVLLIRPVEKLVITWANQNLITHAIYHEEDDAKLIQDADVLIAVKKTKSELKLEKEAKRQGKKIKVIEWKAK